MKKSNKMAYSAEAEGNIFYLFILFCKTLHCVTLRFNKMYQIKSTLHVYHLPFISGGRLDVSVRATWLSGHIWSCL